MSSSLWRIFSGPIGLSDNPQDTHLVEKLSELRIQLYFTYTGEFVLFYLTMNRIDFFFFLEWNYHVNQKKSMLGFIRTFTKSYKPIQNINDSTQVIQDTIHSYQSVLIAVVFIFLHMHINTYLVFVSKCHTKENVNNMVWLLAFLDLSLFLICRCKQLTT